MMIPHLFLAATLTAPLADPTHQEISHFILSKPWDAKEASELYAVSFDQIPNLPVQMIDQIITFFDKDLVALIQVPLSELVFNSLRWGYQDIFPWSGSSSIDDFLSLPVNVKEQSRVWYRFFKLKDGKVLIGVVDFGIPFDSQSHLSVHAEDLPDRIDQLSGDDTPEQAQQKMIGGPMLNIVIDELRYFRIHGANVTFLTVKDDTLFDYALTDEDPAKN